MTTLSNEELQALVARDLPGWRLVVEPEKEPVVRRRNTMPGPTMAQLAAKADATPPQQAVVAPTTRVLRVRFPGGTEKMADVRNGRAVLVQG